MSESWWLVRILKESPGSRQFAVQAPTTSYITDFILRTLSVMKIRGWGDEPRNIQLYKPNTPLQPLDNHQPDKTKLQDFETLSAIYPDGPRVGFIQFLVDWTDGKEIERDPSKDPLNDIAIVLPVGESLDKKCSEKVVTANEITIGRLPGEEMEYREVAVTKPLGNATAQALLESLTCQIQVPKLPASDDDGIEDESETSDGRQQADNSQLTGGNRMVDDSQITNASDTTALATTQGLAQTLKIMLGVDDYKRHFVEDNSCATTDAQLAQFVAAATRHRDKQPGFTASRSERAKEVWLSGVLVDPVLDCLQSLSRNEKSFSAAILQDGRYTVWKPRSDFQLRYSFTPSVGFGLLHGETDSSGQLEADAANKMAIMALHSHKVYKRFTGQDKAIVCTYVSERITTMYIFFSQSSGYRMEQILRYPNIFVPEQKDRWKQISFMRRLHNLLQNVHVTDPPSEKVRELKNVRLPMVSTRGSKRSANDRAPDDRSDEENKRTNRSGGPAEKGPSQTAYGYLVAKHPHMKPAFAGEAFYCEESRGRHRIAKWTTNTDEAQVLRLLQSALHAQYRSHVIPVWDIVNCPGEGSFIVMPRYRELRTLKVRHLTVPEYRDLCFQLAEGVAFLHSQGIAHCDLKLDNLVYEESGISLRTLFIIDFGNARHCESGQLELGFSGTEGWTAPEVQDGQHWDAKKADVWAMGQIAKEFCPTVAPMSPDVMDLCLMDDPLSRPSAADVVAMLSVLPKKVLGKRLFDAAQGLDCLDSVHAPSMTVVSPVS